MCECFPYQIFVRIHVIYDITQIELNFHHICCEYRLESTNVPQDAQDRLAEIVKKLKADPNREKLDVNYLHHAQVNEKRNQTNVL